MASLDVSFVTSAAPRRFAILTSLGKVGAVARAAAQVLTVRILGAGLSYASMVLLARWLGPHDFGIYAYLLVIISLVGLAFSFGLTSSALRFVPSYIARRKHRRLAGFLDLSFKGSLLFSTLGSLTGAGAVLTLRHVIEPYYVTPLLVGLLCIPVWTLSYQLEATARAFGWMNVAYLPGYVVRPFVLISIVGGVYLFGESPNAVVALVALTGACAVAAIVQAVFVVRGGRKHLVHPRPYRHSRRWLLASLGFLTIDGLRMLLDNTDILLIGHLLDPHSVAIYFAVIRTSGLIAFISFSVIASAAPKFAEIHSKGTREELQTFVTSITRMIFWPSFAAALAAVCLGPFLLSLFGPDFAAGYSTMLVVLIGLVLRSATLPVEHLLNMTGHHRDTIKVYAFTAVASIALNLSLIPAFGIMGAAIASYTSMIGGNIWLYRRVRKRLGIDASFLSLGGMPASRPVL